MEIRYEVCERGFLIYNKNLTALFVKEIIERDHLKGMRIFADLKSEYIESFSFLKEYTFLKGLEISSRHENSYDFLNCLNNLEYLNIQNEGTIQIDLSNLKKLKKLVLQWRENIKGLEQLNQLEELSLIDYKEDDLIIIKNLTKLKKLVLKSRLKLTNLKGVENLKELESLTIGDCLRVVDVENIKGLPKLTQIQFLQCKGVKGLDQWEDLPALQSLKFINCKAINSLAFLVKLPSLNNLTILNTKIIDGDLSYVGNVESFKHK